MKKLQKKALVFVLIAAIAISLAVGLAGCGSISITSVTIPAMLALVKGEVGQLNIDYGADKDNVNEDALLEAVEKLELEWSSSDEKVAIVSETGTVTAYAGGMATITVTVKDTDIQSSCEVTVTVPLEALKAEAEMQLYINGTNAEEGYTDSKALDVAPIPADADNVVLSFTSADESIATVDENGVVTAVANGTTIITVSAGEISTEVEIAVYTVPSAIAVEDMALYVGNSGDVKINTEGEDITFGTDYGYESSDEDIVTVDEDGIVSAIGIGEAVITVSNGTGVVGTATITVMPVPVVIASGSSNSASGNTSSGSAGATGSSSGGSTGASGGDEAIETMGPAPEPAPAQNLVPGTDGLTITGAVCEICGAAGHSSSYCPTVYHYHGDGTDNGTCPGCGVHYSQLVGGELVNPETHPEWYC